jgi:uncharacterized membrane protein
MNSKIKETVLILTGAAFAIFGVWGITVPIDESTVVQLINIIFAILGSIGIGLGLRAKNIAKKIDRENTIELNNVRIRKDDDE